MLRMEEKPAGITAGCVLAEMSLPGKDSKFLVEGIGEVAPVYGDMVGDKTLIEDHHLRIAAKLLPVLEERIVNRLISGERLVVTVAGPSGSGKSETSALISGFVNKRLTERGINKRAYTLSCDNYPARPPKENDAHRLELFEQGKEAALQRYLGCGGVNGEILFDRLNGISKAFKSGAENLDLRIMNTADHRVEDPHRPLPTWDLALVVMEGTWSSRVESTDLRIFLWSTPEETREHRIARGRDKLSPFIENIILPIEQGKLLEDKERRAHIVVNRQCEISFTTAGQQTLG